MSCIQVKIGVPVNGDAVIDISPSPVCINVETRATEENIDIQLEDVNYNAEIDISSNTSGATIIHSLYSQADISIGLVCGVDLGVLILCSAEGDLITIDGHYLTISRHAKISS